MDLEEKLKDKIESITCVDGYWIIREKGLPGMGIITRYKSKEESLNHFFEALKCENKIK